MLPAERLALDSVKSKHNVWRIGVDCLGRIEAIVPEMDTPEMDTAVAWNIWYNKMLRRGSDKKCLEIPIGRIEQEEMARNELEEVAWKTVLKVAENGEDVVWKNDNGSIEVFLDKWSCLESLLVERDLEMA